jgi:DNA mismatch repair protein MutS
VVARAQEVLERLEREAGAPAQLGDLPLFAAPAPGLAEAAGPSPVDEALADMDPDGMSPREALEALYQLKGLSRV